MWLWRIICSLVNKLNINSFTFAEKCGRIVSIIEGEPNEYIKF